MRKLLTRTDLTFVDMLTFESKMLGHMVFASVHGRKLDKTGKRILVLCDGDNIFEVFEDELLKNNALVLTDNDLLHCANGIARFFGQLKEIAAIKKLRKSYYSFSEFFSRLNV